MHKFDTFDHLIVNALSPDVYISTPQLCRKFQTNPTEAFEKKGLRGKV